MMSFMYGPVLLLFLLQLLCSGQVVAAYKVEQVNIDKDPQAAAELAKYGLTLHPLPNTTTHHLLPPPPPPPSVPPHIPAGPTLPPKDQHSTSNRKPKTYITEGTPFLAISSSEFHYDGREVLSTSPASTVCVDMDQFGAKGHPPLWTTRNGNIVFAGDTSFHLKGLNW